jgi:DNA modification methylase
METNKIYQGDCLEKMKDVPETAIIVTDPPFNIGYHYENYHDKMNDADYYDMLAKLIGEREAVIIHYPEALHRISIRLERVPEKVVSWVYNSNTAKQHRDIAFYGVKPDFRRVGQPYKNLSDKRIAKRIVDGKTARLYDWWNINQVKNVSKDKTSHPCQMPLEVMERIIGILPENATIVDPFMGSGTTGVACANTGRKFIGIELEPKYVEIANNRIKEALSQTKLKEEVSMQEGSYACKKRIWYARSDEVARI